MINVGLLLQEIGDFPAMSHGRRPEGAAYENAVMYCGVTLGKACSAQLPSPHAGG